MEKITSRNAEPGAKKNHALTGNVENPGATLQVIHNGPMPDLLQNEAQAIMTGRLDADGVFHADELLLKCPTKYEEAVPEQAEE